MRLRGAWDGDHALSRNPRESDLCRGAAFALGQFLDLLYNGEVLVKVFALEFGDWREGRMLR